MSPNKKILLTISLATVLAFLSVVAVVAVFAATRRELTSSIRVRYISMEVSGEATARWKVGSEEWHNMTTGGEANGATKLTFGLEANQNASLSPTDKDIQLTAENDYVVFEYKFTNSGGKDYAIDLFYQDNEIEDTNISVFCLNSDEEIASEFNENINTHFGDWTTTTISANKTKYVYILAKIRDIASDAKYSGLFQFNLDGKDYSSDLEFDGAGTITKLKNNNLSVLHIPSEIDGTPITKIAKNAIIDQSTLIEITIPDSVTEIEQGALNKNCTSLKYISIPFVGATKEATKTPQTCFGYIFGATSDTSQNSSLPTTLTNVIITGGTSIGKLGFYFCTGLTSITIPSGVINIGNNAFFYCTGLTSITIPSGVINIGNSAFFYCTGLTSITIPSGVTNIGEGAFQSCSGLTGDLTIPSGVESIGKCAFDGCSGFNGNLTIPQGVTSIGDKTFEDCSGFTGNLTIPSGVTSIGSNAFYNCGGFNGNLIIPQGVASIGDGAFENCSGFTGNLVIPGSVSFIGYRAFQKCSGFNGGLTIEQGVTNIRNYAFSLCSGLTSVTIPSSVTNIGFRAFNSCSKLTEVTIESEYVYTEATSRSACEELLNYAKTIRVLTSLIPTDPDDYAENGHAYINKTNFPTITTESINGKDYTVYKK